MILKSSGHHNPQILRTLQSSNSHSTTIRNSSTDHSHIISTPKSSNLQNTVILKFSEYHNSQILRTPQCSNILRTLDSSNSQHTKIPKSPEHHDPQILRTQIS
ncbi:hypothetical protein Zmor_010261 [Zophobas morio]|uniref:Uncharacterized protein n=1 Tax=Zophobas morio TaxID=2755281 RepID=A0AA38IQR4_9CUCU|nr:hypothetical protein Zmor_010261 [Zophobas morio]